MCSEGQSARITESQRVFAASAGALATSLLMTPFDVVKIRLQQQRKPFAIGTCFIYHNGLMDHVCRACAEPVPARPCEWYHRPGHFTGMLDAFVKIPRTEGLRSLWSGLTPTMMMAVPATVFYFTVYDNLMDRLRQRADSWANPLVAGCSARTTAATLVAPLELVRTKMQSEKLNYQGIYWSTYEFLKSAVQRRRQHGFTTSFACGLGAGATATLLTHPFDVVKTRQQVHIGEGVSPLSARTVVRQMLDERGARGFLSGLLPRLSRVSFACAIMIGNYEYAKLYFARRNRVKRKDQ